MLSSRALGLFLLIVMGIFSGQTQDYNMYNFTALRNDMVEGQIISRGVEDPGVLRAMRKIERHKFVPVKYVKDAYRDSPLPIGYDQTISQPYIVAFMTEALELDGSEKVLEIGTGSGYQAAVLAELVKEVYSIEIVRELGEQSEKVLAENGYDNVHIKIGDGYQGWEEHGPYDAIIVTCSPTHIPEPLQQQLEEGGRMIIPVGNTYSQNLYLMEKEDGRIKEKKVLPVRFVPMMDNNGKRY